MDWRTELLKPEGGRDFERLMLKVCRVIYGVKFSLFGRSGQRQHGIDLYTSGFTTCVQCKNCKDISRLRSMMEEEFTKAVQHFGPKLKRYIIATTLDTDTSIQEHADELLHLLPEEQRENLTFELLFWEQILECLKEHPEFVPAGPNVLSEYDQKLPNMETNLWWMCTAPDPTPFRISFGNFDMWSFEEGNEHDAADEWVDQDECLLPYHSSVQWLDDRRPIQVGPLLTCTQGRGMFFLVSNWMEGLTDSLNSYAVDLLDDVWDIPELAYGWVEIHPDESSLLTDDHSGTVVVVDNGQVNMDDIVRCVEKWKNLHYRGQLIFHFCGTTDSVLQWKDLVSRAKMCIQQLRSRFGTLPISLLSAYNPLRDPLLLSSVTCAQMPPEEERAVDWMCRNPDKIANVVYASARSLKNMELLLPALSAWSCILEKLFGGMGTEYTQKIINHLDLDYQMSAIALYHLYRADSQWEYTLTDCLKLCSITAKQTVMHLMDPDYPLPENVDPVFYGMLTDYHPQSQTALPSVGGRLMQILNNPVAFRSVIQDTRGRIIMGQIGNILLPGTDQDSDETTESYRNLIRPYH